MGRPKSIGPATCQTCGKLIDQHPSRPRRYCDKQCYGKAKLHASTDFWSNVERGSVDGCWLWVGSVGKHGYGTIKFNRTYDYAHRLAYRLQKGPIPPGLFIRHRCNNKLCCNPRHLEPGTHRQNMDDVVLTNRRGVERLALLAEIERAEDRLNRLRRALEELE